MPEKYLNVPGSYYSELRSKGHPAQRFFYETREAYLLEFARLKKSDIVADVGCGSGIVSEKISPHVKKVIGVDLSAGSISFAQKRAKKLKLKNISYKTGRAEKIPLPNNSIDVCILSHVIEHSKQPHKALQEAKRVLRKGGKLIIATPNYHSMWPLAEFLFDKTLAKQKIAGKNYSLEEQHVSRFSHAGIRKMVSEEGFRVEGEKTLYFLSLPLALLHEGLGRKVFHGIDAKLSRLPIGMISYVRAVKE
ncbi:MAG: methyltransferase domain-containing protein [Candidatus Diapherotrites archaeon]